MPRTRVYNARDARDFPAFFVRKILPGMLLNCKTWSEKTRGKNVKKVLNFTCFLVSLSLLFIGYDFLFIMLSYVDVQVKSLLYVADFFAKS